MPEDHISKNEFILEFFGNFGRELGDPIQSFTDNPSDILPFVEECARDKKPAFMSVQPRIKHDVVFGIERIFYDFDYGKKSDKMTDKQIEKHKINLEIELRIFLNHLVNRNITPLIIKTQKGYHVHIYLDSVYEISDDEVFWSQVYKTLFNKFIRNNKHEYKYIDMTSSEDIKRLSRIPFSIHQKSGEECIILDINLKPTKIRGIQYYKQHGLKYEDWENAKSITEENLRRRKEEFVYRQKERKEEWEMNHGFTGNIRPCFKVKMEGKEMTHLQRLALLIEAYYAGYRNIESMIEVFKPFNDFNERVTRTQVKWFFENVVIEAQHKCKTNPYRCSTMQKFGWCIGNKCDIYNKRQEKENDKT